MSSKIAYWFFLLLSVLLVASLKHIAIFIYVYFAYDDFYWAEDALRDIIYFAIPLFLGLVVKKYISNKFSIK